MRAKRHLTIIGLAVAVTLIASACSNDDDAESGSCEEITVEEAFVRLPPAENTALYFEVTNNGDSEIALVGASTDVATMVELHENIMNDGVMTMQPVEGQEIPVAAGATAVLEPGGLHVMAMGLTATLEEGDDVTWTLEFSNGCTTELTAPVKAIDS
jgi:copper(I)-binding protein